MDNIVSFTCGALTIGSVDISDPESAFEEMLRVSRIFPGSVAFGDFSNYVTFREGKVCSVVFYDCFWDVSESREEQAFRTMVDAICEKASSSAWIVCRTRHEYIAAVNNRALYEANVLRSVLMSGD